MKTPKAAEGRTLRYKTHAIGLKIFSESPGANFQLKCLTQSWQKLKNAKKTRVILAHQCFYYARLKLLV